MASGTCGKNLTWSLDSNGTLTISGTGKMFDCTTYGSNHWLSTPIKRVVIHDGVTYIGKGAFSSCTSLMSVIIPEGVTTICSETFSDCISLKEIYYPTGRGFEKALSQGNKAKFIPYNPAPSTVSKPKPQPVVEQLRWKVEGKTLTSGGVRKIKCYSYADTPWIDSSHKIQKIIFEDGVEEIAANAFIDCTRLEQVIIPASVKTIGDCAFTVCYCGERTVNGGRNVIWSLGNGVLMIKKNPAAKSETNFATGFETWQVVEKNIVSVKIERGVVLSKQFFDWMAQRGNNLQVSFE